MQKFKVENTKGTEVGGSGRGKHSLINGHIAHVASCSIGGGV